MTITSIASTTNWVVTPTSSPSAATCSGTTYAIKSTDTCYSISLAEGISTQDLLSANHLQAHCADFPTSGSLCIPSDSVCTPYTVKANDTCVSIASKLTPVTSYAQIVSWNPAVGSPCNNLVNMVGWVICVTNPGGTWVDPNPPSSTVPSSTTAPNTIALTPFSMFPSQTAASNFTTIPWANGTWNDCQYYVVPPVLTNQSTGATSFACADVAQQYGVTVAEIVTWNPSLESGAACNMTADQQYCVGTYIAQTNATASCVQYELAQPGYDCYTFSNMYGIEYSQFLSWNPEVGDGCQNYAMGVQYCIAVSGFRQPGIVSNCNLLVQPYDTNWADLPCQIIETEYGLSHARFVAWNPAVQQNCTGLYPGYEYCVSIPNYKPTYTTTATTVATPTLPSLITIAPTGPA